MRFSRRCTILLILLPLLAGNVSAEPTTNGVEMQLAFHSRLRPELKFASVDALIEQMVEDEVRTRRWLGDNRTIQAVPARSAEPATTNQIAPGCTARRRA